MPLHLGAASSHRRLKVLFSKTGCCWPWLSLVWGRELNFAGREECAFQTDSFISGCLGLQRYVECWIPLLATLHGAAWGSPRLLCAGPSTAPGHTEELPALPTFQPGVRSARQLVTGSRERQDCACPLCPLLASSFSLKSCWEKTFQAGTVQINTHAPERLLWWRRVAAAAS